MLIFLGCINFTNFFAPDAAYNFQGQISAGSNAIHQTCLDVFQAIPYREHSFTKAYTFGWNGHEIALEGTVRYGMDVSKNLTREWCEIFELVETNGQLKIETERVFVVRTIENSD
jgi:hypothetical protein